MKYGRGEYIIEFTCDASLIENVVQSFLKANNYVFTTEGNESFYKIGRHRVDGNRYFKYVINGNTITIHVWLKTLLGDINVKESSINLPSMAYRDKLKTLFEEIDKINGNLNSHNQMKFDSNTGEPINNNQMKFDPNTGEPINNNQMKFDPNTGEPINNNGMKFDPNTGEPINNNQMKFDPNTGEPINNTNNQVIENNKSTFFQSFQNDINRKDEKNCEIGFWISIVSVFCSLLGIALGIILYIFAIYFLSRGLKTSKRKKAIIGLFLCALSFIITIITVF